MNEDAARLHYLLHQYASQTSTENEERELFNYLLNESYESDIQLLMNDMMSRQEPVSILKDQWRPVIEEILGSKADSQYHQTPHPKRVYHLSWHKWMIAAAVVMAVGFSTYFGFFNSSETQTTVRLEPQKQRFKNDVLPGSTVPHLVLADGRTVNLDSAQMGELALERGVRIIRKDNGEIEYQSVEQRQPSPIQFNTISNPRGSKVVSLSMVDGSRVWLDAGSSITYPTAFQDKERVVEITGQAYFEVAHHLNWPFKVKKSNEDAEVQVLGTHFNILAFESEEAIQVTLLEGSVKVTKGINSQVIKPGEQAQMDTRSSSIRVERNVDVASIMGWKNGIFKFQEVSIQAIMKQLARWYDVEVVFEENPTDRFVSTIPRDVPISQVLKILETTGRVHFKIEGKKVIVMK